VRRRVPGLRAPGPLRCAPEAVLLLLAAGCVGGKAHLRADHLSHPVSLSRSYVGSEGSVIGPDRQEVVAPFTFVVRRWSLFWTLLPLSSRVVDLSDLLEERIRAAGGEAVVDLTLKVFEDPLSVLTLFVPVVPSRVSVHVAGDVVRRKKDR